ncbi:MAG: hypothetical protein KJO21_13290 [Verrucomicrobiae bacterium]|nr:hypothetical protein [Verrucomicrobiae bacterium]NNJ44294.1 hypothetical protein [Akkermansiaceae bacterium]
MKIRNAIFSTLVVMTLVSGAELFAKARSVSPFGPTGLMGTLSKKGAKVTQVAKGSPADGKIKKGDEIIGLGSHSFKGNVRESIAAAIDEAETKKASGKLTVTLKGGKKVDLQLKVLGEYSKTTPYDCPKSDLIIHRAAEYLSDQIKHSLDPKNRKSRGRFNSGATHSALLGLMATGEQKYIDLVAKVIQGSAMMAPNVEEIDAQLKGEKPMGYVGWYWGYHCILLGEYFLLTGDESVLPALKVYAVSLAKGQDAGGMWGHRMAVGGRLPGYAQMNQSSLSSFMGMLMAQKCGIDDPDLQKGIEKTYAYYSTYIGEGAFNYGVHGPNKKAFNNNGTSGSGTMCMALADNQEGVKFFSRLSSAAHGSLEQGHASNFFNPLWTPLGANLCGPEVTQQFFKKSQWFNTTTRLWDGSFSRNTKESGKEGSQTGVALLSYCLPRKALMITGRFADSSLWLKGDQATDVVQMSEIDYASKSVDELIAMFDNPFPQVRGPAVWGLRTRGDDFIPKLVEMLESGSQRQKISVMEYFGYKCPPEQAHPQIDKIGAILRNVKEDVKLRVKAASTLSCYGEMAHAYYNDILQFIVDDEPGDHFRDADQSLGRSLNNLCSTPFASGLVTDKELFYKAANKLIDHKRQHGRAEGVRMLSDIPMQDFAPMAGKVMYIIKDEDRTYHSYHTWQSTIGPAIEVLAGLNIKEGLPYAAGIIDREGGKWGFKVRMLCAALPKYGGNAKESLAKIKTDKRLKDIEKSRFGGIWRKMVKAIDGDPSPKKLISLEDALNNGAE